MQAWRRRWLQHLDSSGSIDMCDCLEPRAPFAPNGKDARHETCQARAARRNIEIACCHFEGDDRCERAKRLAVLDFAVEAIAHLSRMRRRKDAAMAKRTWSELKSALHPSDDAIGRQIVSNLIDQPKVPKKDDRVDRGPDFQSKCGHNKAPRQLRIRHLLAQAERTRAQNLILRGYVRWLRRLKPHLLPSTDPASRFPHGVLGPAARVCPPEPAGRWQRNRRTADLPRCPDQ